MRGPPGGERGAVRARHSLKANDGLTEPSTRPARKGGFSALWPTVWTMALPVPPTSHGAERVIAAMVVGSNGATSLAGTSHGLRTEEDRQRFLTLRRSDEFGAILVGRATTLVEPYGQAPHPLYIYSREISESLSSYLEKIMREVPGKILCEGGVSLLHALIREDLLDTFHLSRVLRSGDGHFLDEALLAERMVLVSATQNGDTVFDRYERASR